MNKYVHLIKLRDQPNYLIAKTSSERSRFIAFKEFKTALTCKKYMVEYKLKYGNWPDFNLNEKTEQFLTYKMHSEKLDYKEIEQSIELASVKYEESEAMMLLSLIGMIYCIKFDVINGTSKYNLAISAEEADVKLDNSDIIRNFKAAYNS